MYCRECGKQLREDSKFCNQCGTKVEKEAVNVSDVTTNTVVKPKKQPQKSWYEEIGAVDVNNYGKNNVSYNATNNDNEGMNYLFMTISMIWLAISGFMPIIDGFFGDEGFTFIDIGDVLELLFDYGFNDDLLMAIAFMCKASFIVGIILALVYFVKLLALYRDSEAICKISLIATILLAIPTVVVFIAQLIINSKANEIFSGAKVLSFSAFGWITLVVIIMNIIISRNFMLMSYRKRYRINSGAVFQKTCLICRTKYEGVSCPDCGSSMIMK